MYVSIVAIFLIFLFYYLWDVYSYWKRRGVVGPTPLPLIGNYGPVLFGKTSESEFFLKLYRNYPNEKCIGIYQGLRPILILRDADMVRDIFVKEAHLYYRESDVILANTFHKTLIGVKDYELRKVLRKSILPLFKKSQFLNMMHLVNYPLEKYMQFVNDAVDKETDNDMTILNRKFTEVIMRALLSGEQSGNVLEEIEYQKNVSSFTSIALHNTIVLIARTYPLVLKLVLPILKKISRSVLNFIYNYFLSALKTQEASKENLNTFLDQLAKIKGIKNKRVQGRDVDFDEEFVVQNCVLLALSHELLSTVMTLIIHDLVQNQDIQQKVYEEIVYTLEKCNGKLTTESLYELKYLDMVIDESLRLHSINNIIDRRCLATCKIPGTDIYIDQRVFVYALAEALHHDPKYFPNPEIFNPERFSPENRNFINKGSHMVFGLGPQNCIGRPLSKFVILMGVATLLHKLKFLPCGLTTKKLVFNSGITRTINGEIWAKIQRRS